MKYFKECTTVEEVKAEFRKLAFLLHPDKGGSTAEMQELNKAYKFAIAKVLSTSGSTAEEINDEILRSEEYATALQSIIHLEGLKIELVGSWIWVEGDTYTHRKALKEAKFMYASKKKSWYFRSKENEVKRRTGKTIPMSEIKAKYGSKTIANKKRFAIS